MKGVADGSQRKDARSRIPFARKTAHAGLQRVTGETTRWI
jgi:hypothetical protein